MHCLAAGKSAARVRQSEPLPWPCHHAWMRSRSPLRAVIFIPIHQSEQVLQTSSFTILFYKIVPQTVFGMGMGMNVAAYFVRCHPGQARVALEPASALGWQPSEIDTSISPQTRWRNGSSPPPAPPPAPPHSTIPCTTGATSGTIPWHNPWHHATQHRQVSFRMCIINKVVLRLRVGGGSARAMASGAGAPRPAPAARP